MKSSQRTDNQENTMSSIRFFAMSSVLSVMAAGLVGCFAEEDSSDERGAEGVGEQAATAQILQVGSTNDYDSHGTVTIDRPTSRAGDLLVLFLSRTDDFLPLRLSGWTKAAECFKTGNSQRNCLTERHCTEWEDSSYCRTFGSGGVGRDLATVAFYKTVGSSERGSYTWDLRGEHPAWAIMTALRGAATTSPVRAWAGVSNDRNSDSMFPSVDGSAGDMLLLSQGFDDTADRDDFRAPDGTSFFQYTVGSDEAGYLFGKLLTATGPTGQLKTHGDGGPADKDVLLALTIKPRT